jgi:D-alanine--D-alanine ligase
MDHTQALCIEITPFFVSQDLKFYEISRAQLYSNTPSDFDFKLQQTSEPMDKACFIEKLHQVDLVFPCIHGEFGEDGQLQAMLEHYDIPYIGVDSTCADTMYNKNKASAFLADKGYFTLESLYINRNDEIKGVEEFLTSIDNDRVIVKPAAGGSSIGVQSVERDVKKIKAAAHKIFETTNSDVLVEPFCKGREFTIIILQGKNGKAVPLLPTEIEVSYKDGKIFDYRRKYLPTANTYWHTPARFEEAQIKQIREDATRLFQDFDMRDFARIDGWVLNDGQIIFTDFNPISGMEQNSFIFQQTSRLGYSHQDALAPVILSACQRYNIDWQPEIHASEDHRKPVFVLFGSDTAERQVSVMSGTNIWLKLRHSTIYAPQPYFMDKNHHIYIIPYSYALNHTVEEIAQNCKNYDDIQSVIARYKNDINSNLLLEPSLEASQIEDYTLEEFIAKAKADQAFVFLALHGGLGEDGRIQTMLESKDVPFNGSGSTASQICMDKEMTGKKVKDIGDETISSLPKTLIRLDHVYSDEEMGDIWASLQQEFESNAYIIKPRSDGCSAGIVKITSLSDLKTYLKFVNEKADYIPENMFEGQGDTIIELGGHTDPYLMIEPYIAVDKITVRNGQLNHRKTKDWIEYTVGVLEKDGRYHAFNPSITVAENSVLSLEEKFQGGTGINITPPPKDILSDDNRLKLRRAIEKTAAILGIENYARIDCFYNAETGRTIIIEANSLPGMTPSTVIYHQALAEDEPLYPTAFIEKLIGLKTGVAHLMRRASKAA